MSRVVIRRGLERIAEAEERNQRRIAIFLRDQQLKKQEEERKDREFKEGAR